MTQEEKQLLLKDLCARLPYFENWIQYEGKDYILTGYGHGRVSLLPSLVSSSVGPCPLIEEVKPYLRPMSSMTEEEREEFRTLILPEASCAYEDCLEWDAQIIGGGYLQISVEDFSKVVDWLNAHHFDYRGLIEKGLALEAPEGMYKTR